MWRSASSKASVAKSSFDSDRPWPPSPSTSSSSAREYDPLTLKRAQSNLSLGSSYLGGGSEFRPFMPSSLNPRPPSEANTLDSARSDATYNPTQPWPSSPSTARQPPTQTPTRPGNSRSASSTPKQASRPLFSSHSSGSLKPSIDSTKDDYGGGLNVGFRVRKKSSKLSLKSLASSAKQSIFSSHSTSGTQPSSPPTSPLRSSPHSPSFASRGPNAPPLNISAPSTRPFCPPSPTPHYQASGSLDLDRSASRGLETPGFFGEEHGAGGVRGKAAKLLGESVVPSGKAAKLLGMDQGVKPTKPHSPKTEKHKASTLRIETGRNQSAMGWFDLASDAGSPVAVPLSAPPDVARAPSPPKSLHRPPSRTPSHSNSAHTPSSAASSTYHPPSHSPHSARDSQTDFFHGETERECRASSPVSSTFHSPPPSIIARRHRSSTFNGLPPFLNPNSRSYSDPQSIPSSPRDTIYSLESKRESRLGRDKDRESQFGSERGARRGQRDTWLSAAAGEINLGSIAMDEGAIRARSKSDAREQGQGGNALGMRLSSPIQEEAGEHSPRQSPTSSGGRRAEVATSAAYSLASSAGWSDRSTSYGIPSVFYPFAGIPASAVPHSPVSTHMPLSPASTHFRPDSPPPVPPINPALLERHSNPRSSPKPPTRSLSPPSSPAQVLASFPAPGGSPHRSPFGPLPPTKRPGRSNTVMSAVSSASAGTKRYQRGNALDALEGRRAIVQAAPMPKLGPALGPVPEGGVAKAGGGGGRGQRTPPRVPVRARTADEVAEERRKARESRPFLDWSDSEDEAPAKEMRRTPPQARLVAEDDTVLRVTPPRTSSKANRPEFGNPFPPARTPPGVVPALPLPPLPVAPAPSTQSPELSQQPLHRPSDTSTASPSVFEPAARGMPALRADLGEATRQREREASVPSTAPSTPGSPEGRRGARGRSDSLFSWLSSSSEEEWMDRFPEPPKFGEGEVGGMIGGAGWEGGGGR